MWVSWGLGPLGIADCACAAGRGIPGRGQRPTRTPGRLSQGRGPWVRHSSAHWPTTVRPAITAMPSADALKSVAAGDGGLAATSRRDGIWVEMSTVPPPVKCELADSLA